jgi:hypothetical protein
VQSLHKREGSDRIGARESSLLIRVVTCLRVIKSTFRIAFVAGELLPLNLRQVLDGRAGPVNSIQLYLPLGSNSHGFVFGGFIYIGQSKPYDFIPYTTGESSGHHIPAGIYHFHLGRLKGSIRHADTVGLGRVNYNFKRLFNIQTNFLVVSRQLEGLFRLYLRPLI